MSRSIKLVSTLTLLTFATGCGTMYSLVSPKIENKVYGGVQADTALISHMVGGGSSGGQIASGGPGGAALALAVVALPVLDLGVSAVADTLLLPPILLWEHVKTSAAAAPTPIPAATPAP